MSMESPLKNLKLTQTVQKGGCAAKVAASELRQILSQVRFPPQDSKVLVDGGLFDDAAVYQVSEDLALVQTLDFFTPIVDSPRIFGRVAAANALSDVYAMGALPKTALAILAFPLGTFPNEVVVEVLQGACDILTEAQVNFLGGHSIDDDTMKFGLSVTGYVHPKKIWSNAKAQVGDVLILTKALGTGTLSAALKRGAVDEADLAEALASMSQLNLVPALLSPTEMESVHSATDITGFGFLGHSYQMAKASQKIFEIFRGRIPQLSRALDFLEKSFLTKAHRSNWDYVKEAVELGPSTEIERLLLVDPQTSGGLLLSVAADQAESTLQKIRSKFPRADIVGRVVESQKSTIQVLA